MQTRKPRIIITSGEPAGIGPDICLSLPELELHSAGDIELYIIADPGLISERAQLLDLKVELNLHYAKDRTFGAYDSNKLNIIPLSLTTRCEAGKLNSKNSTYVLQMLDIACELCQKNEADAMVTGPVQKNIINEAGFEFTGHTEYLAEKSSATPVMMLATDKLRVALATTHLPLRDVSDAISQKTLTETIDILNKFLIDKAGISRPRILVCGLNPHAGENGNLGNEEITTIIPVLEAMKKQGLDLIGPLPADTLFTPKHLQHADAVLAMYHDQGLPVLKYSGFGKAVNVTLGLPFIRTSVDHGTALDLAATGKASNSSLIEAINMAIKLSKG